MFGGVAAQWRDRLQEISNNGFSFKIPKDDFERSFAGAFRNKKLEEFISADEEYIRVTFPPNCFQMDEDGIGQSKIRINRDTVSEIMEPYDERLFNLFVEAAKISGERILARIPFKGHVADY